MRKILSDIYRRLFRARAVSAAAVDALRYDLRESRQELREHRHVVQALAGDLDGQRRQHQEFRDSQEERHRLVEQRLQALERQTDEHRRKIQLGEVMDWIAQAELSTRPLISVIMPTRDRAALLPRAIASVQAQVYENWELLAVDDASGDETQQVLAAVGDKRLRAFKASGAGASAARNVGLRHAGGEIIAYLDDDNTMHPQWLKSVVWAFEQRPRTEVLYGAYSVDDSARVGGRNSGDMPHVYFHRYDHESAAQSNIADMSCIAHRAGLPEAHFDETLQVLVDWDLFLRLTRESPPLALPALACFYRTDSPNRLSARGIDEYARVRSKNRR